MTPARARPGAARRSRRSPSAGLALYAGQAAVAMCGSRADAFFETYVYTGLMVATAARCASPGRSPLQRRASGLARCSASAWRPGPAATTYYVGRRSPRSPTRRFPSFADVLWLTFYPCLLRGARAARARPRAQLPPQPLARRPDRGRSRRRRRRRGARGGRDHVARRGLRRDHRSTSPTSRRSASCSASWWRLRADRAGGPAGPGACSAPASRSRGRRRVLPLPGRRSATIRDSTLPAVLWPASALIVGLRRLAGARAPHRAPRGLARARDAGGSSP